MRFKLICELLKTLWFVYVFEHMQGAQEVFKELPHEFVSPDSLEDVVKNGGRFFIIHVSSWFYYIVQCTCMYM